MNIDELIPPELESSSFVGPIRALDRLYTQADAACAEFRAVSGSHCEQAPACPEGCGSCCERFVPDALPAEADLAALWILRHRPDLASVEARRSPPCPYYDAERPEAHCRIYEARPLICRMFGFSSAATKAGEPSYALCWKMPASPHSAERSWEGLALETTFGMSPPMMADFGLMLEALGGSLARPRMDLAGSIAASLQKIRLVISLSGVTPT